MLEHSSCTSSKSLHRTCQSMPRHLMTSQLHLSGRRSLGGQQWHSHVCATQISPRSILESFLSNLSCTCSQLVEEVQAGQHTLESFAQEVRSVLEATMVQLFGEDRPAATRVMLALDAANDLLADAAEEHAQPLQPRRQQAQMVPIDDRGLWLPPCAHRFLHPPLAAAPACQSAAWQPRQRTAAKAASAAMALAAQAEPKPKRPSGRKIYPPGSRSGKRKPREDGSFPARLGKQARGEEEDWHEEAKLLHQSHPSMTQTHRQYLADFLDRVVDVHAELPLVRCKPETPGSRRRAGTHIATALGCSCCHELGPPSPVQIGLHRRAAKKRVWKRSRRCALEWKPHGFTAFDEHPLQREHLDAHGLSMECCRRSCSRTWQCGSGAQMPPRAAAPWASACRACHRWVNVLRNACGSNRFIGRLLGVGARLNVFCHVQGLRQGQFDCLADVAMAVEEACSSGLHTFLEKNIEGEQSLTFRFSLAEASSSGTDVPKTPGSRMCGGQASRHQQPRSEKLLPLSPGYAQACGAAKWWRWRSSM